MTRCAWIYSVSAGETNFIFILILISVWNTLIGRWDHRSGKVSLENLRATQVDLADNQQRPLEPKIERADNHQESSS